MEAIEKPIIFSAEPIPNDIFDAMQGKSFHRNPYIAREDLTYLRLGHYGFDGVPHQGEMIVNRKIEAEVLQIFRKLYQEQYPIEKMRLVDAYHGDDNRSMADNNSSAFNYRLIAGTDRLSKHSLGLAIDINPKYNPYIRPGENGEFLVEPEGSLAYVDRSMDFPYKIHENDLCCRIFKEYGYSWGGDWNRVKDYQHFQKDGMMP